MNARTRLIAPIDPNLQPVTLTEAKTQNRVDCPDEDSLITSYISVATQHAAEKIGRALMPARYRLTLDSFPDVIELLPPVMSLESVAYVDKAGATQTLALGSVLLDSISEPGRLFPAPGTSWPETMTNRPNAVTIEFTAGYAAGAIPPPVKQWILLAVGDMYERRTRSSDTYGRGNEKPSVPQQFAEALLDASRVWTV